MPFSQYMPRIGCLATRVTMETKSTVEKFKTVLANMAKMRFYSGLYYIKFCTLKKIICPLIVHVKTI